MNKTAQEVMTKKLITMAMGGSVLEAYQLMQKNRIRHLPVVDESGVLVGLISERDVYKCIRYDRESHSKQLDVELSLDPKIKVVEAMSWPVHRVTGDVSIRDVALQMLNGKMSSVLVECQKSGRRGIITTDDLLKLLISMLDKDPSRLRLAIDSLMDDFIPAVGM